MKAYISADNEGVTGVTLWDETSRGKPGYEQARHQMTAEVAAACEGALAGGATEIFVQDAHDGADNLIAGELPRQVQLVRGWSGGPMSMMQELDATFDAAIMIGYHGRAGGGASPLEHTYSGRATRIRINDRPVAEFTIAAYAAAHFGIPSVLVSGDAGVCSEAESLVAGITTVPVKRGVGGSTISIHPGLAIDRIREGAQAALAGDLTACRIRLPERITLEIVFRHHAPAYRASFYPGATQPDPMTVRYEAPDIYEALRALGFLLG
ncbi:M55 family metallopeptidase [Candidatus Bipolaricaulota bacterium]|nr:M55 family metallopeptidase [Candidatus Bipolaricaulota bacterium]